MLFNPALFGSAMLGTFKVPCRPALRAVASAPHETSNLETEYAVRALEVK
jgi:hypothetical protein